MGKKTITQTAKQPLIPLIAGAYFLVISPAPTTQQITQTAKPYLHACQ